MPAADNLAIRWPAVTAAVPTVAESRSLRRRQWSVMDNDPDDVKQSIRMTADRILALPTKELGERKSRAGIVIPETAAQNRRLGWAKVVAVGPTVRNVEEGDLVLFAPDAGFEVDIRGDDHLILRERDVHAVASSRDEGQTGLYL
jgi:chaperonin GroES